MNNKVLLSIGVLLVLLGVFKPSIPSLLNNGSSSTTLEQYETDAPSNPELLEKSKIVIEILQSVDHSTKSYECQKLSALYYDLATLVELDNEDLVIKDTNAIREANGLAGKMLKLNIKDKYPNLAKASQDLVVSQLGDNDVVLDADLRKKAAECFKALSWAFYQGKN
jgi:hypothetical protein